MPMIKFCDQQPGAWAVWQITETETELSALSFETCPAEIGHQVKRLEFLAARVLLQKVSGMQGISFQGIHKNAHGKPFLSGAACPISLTHSYPFVAAQLHPRDPVGIDLEQPKEKLLRVAPRFLSHQELADAGKDLTKLCVYWCAKEALYKLRGTPGLNFASDLHIVPFVQKPAGLLSATIQTNPAYQVKLYYRVEPEYVIAVTESVTPR